MTKVPRELYDPSGVIADMIDEEWSTYNTVEEGTAEERDVKKPDIIPKEQPPVGSSSRSLPRTIRAQPVLYVWDNGNQDREKGDLTGATENFDATVRAQIIVANGLNGMDGTTTREDYIMIIESIRQNNYAPPGGIAGTRWSNLHPGPIDRTPTEYSEQWRANIDFQLDAHNVKV